MGSIIGIDAPHKQFPTIVSRNKHLFQEIAPLKIIDIGAGHGFSSDHS